MVTAATMAWSPAALAAGPITVVVPFPAGSVPDGIAKALTPALARALGHEVLIENVAGAVGGVGASRFAQAPADGRTLLLSHHILAAAPGLELEPKVAAERFAPIGLVAELPMLLVARPGLGAKTAGELAALLDRTGKTLNIANLGPGSNSQLCSAMMQDALGPRLNVVPYRNVATVMSEVAAGTQDLVCDLAVNWASQVEAKKVQSLGVTSRAALSASSLIQRMGPQRPLMDQGLRGFKDVSVWHALWAPSGTAPDLVQALDTALRKAVNDPAFVAHVGNIGAAPVAAADLGPDALAARLKADTAKWTAVLGGRTFAAAPAAPPPERRDDPAVLGGSGRP